MENRVKETLTEFRRADTLRTVSGTPPLEIREEDGRCGIVNAKGKTVVPFRYHNMYAAAPGQIVLIRNGKAGLLRILWDAQNSRYLLTQTLKCEYDAVEAATDRILILRRGGRFAWYSVRGGGVSALYRAVQVIGGRFCEGIGSQYEKEVLCDLHAGTTYVSETECCHEWAGRNADGDVLMRRGENTCRLVFFADTGEMHATRDYRDIAVIRQRIAGEDDRILAFVADETVLDAGGSEVGTISGSAPRCEIRDGNAAVWGAGIGFAEWDRVPRRSAETSGDSLPDLARRALDGIRPLPLAVKRYGTIRARRRGSIKAGSSALLRQMIRKTLSGK